MGIVTMQRNTKTFILLCCAYIISQFHRSALAVVSTDLAKEFSLSIPELGTVTAAFFIAFMVFQIPAGLMLDRYGARKTLFVLLLINALGSLLFALGQGYLSLTFARVLIGIGNSTLLIGTLIIIGKIFPLETFARYSAILLAIGTLGNLLSTFPMAYVHELLGWRYAFYFFTLVPLLFGYGVLKMVEEYPVAAQNEGVLQIWQGFRAVVKVQDFWKMFLVQLCWYAGTMSLFALWGRPFLRDVHGLNSIESGYVLMLFPIMSIIAYIVMGGFDVRFNTRKWLVVAGIGSNAFSFLLMGLFPNMPLWLFSVLVGVIGMAAGCFPFLLAHGRASFPPAILGRGIALLNLANMGGVGIMQILTAQIYEVLASKGVISTQIYPKLYLLIAFCLGTSMVVYAFAQDKKPR
jgi:predicted MFS family arabinose efflux permease